MTRYSVSGTLNPNATTPDTGEPAGTYGGKSYWQWVKDGTTYRMYWFFVNWIITSAELGANPGTYWWLPNPPPPDAPAGAYSAGGSATGTATVAEYVPPVAAVVTNILLGSTPEACSILNSRIVRGPL